MSQDVDALCSGILGRDPGDNVERGSQRERIEWEREKERQTGSRLCKCQGVFSPRARPRGFFSSGTSAGARCIFARCNLRFIAGADFQLRKNDPEGGRGRREEEGDGTLEMT